MKYRWSIPLVIAVFALALVILLSGGQGLARAQPTSVVVTKSVSPTAVAPGETVAYTVLLENTSGSAVEVSSVVDTLPAGFQYVGLTTGTEWGTEPFDNVAPEIQWAGPIPIPAGDSLALQYYVYVPASVPPSPDSYINTVVATVGTEASSAQANLTVAVSDVVTAFLPFAANNWAPPVFTVSKTANPAQGFAEAPGALIAYTAEFYNSGTVAGVLADVRDTLPPGFTFVRMLAPSNVTTNPSGTTGTIVWSGPFTVEGKGTLKLIYEVRASTTVGTYVNSVTGTATIGQPPAAPATATVEITEPVLLREEFESPSPYWQPFLNYWRLDPEQWYLKPNASDDGSTVLGHTWWYGVSNPVDGAHDALYMYKDPAAELWTDYSYQTRVYMGYSDADNRGQVGVWFRGKHQDSDLAGRWVTGYYFTIKPLPPRYAYLMQLRTDEECGNDCDFNYHFSNPLLLERRTGTELAALQIALDSEQWYTLRVEVDGPQIRCYIDGTLVFDYYDNVGTTFTEGTVGFATYIAGDARFDHVLVEPLR